MSTVAFSPFAAGGCWLWRGVRAAGFAGLYMRGFASTGCLVAGGAGGNGPFAFAECGDERCSVRLAV